MEVLHLRSTRVDLRRYGPKASVCGWAVSDPPINVEFEDANNLDNLHCITIRIYGKEPCERHIPYGDYKNKLYCGKADSAERETPLVNMFQKL